MVGGILFEHGHRMIAGTVTILTAILAIWTWRVETRPAVRRLGIAAVITVLVQAILGGVTVLYLLPTPISVAHACLGQIFFCLTVAMAVVTGRSWSEASQPHSIYTGASPVSHLAAACTGVVFLQLLLGALMRHTGAGLAIPDFPLAFGRLVPELTSEAVTIHFAHRVWALVVTAVILVTAARAWPTGNPQLRRPALALAGLVFAQILFGGITVWTGKAPFPTTVHVATGAAILATSVGLTLRSRQAANMNMNPRSLAPTSHPGRKLA
jgi:cytochrome c oxidase assembly protein subunit 15